MATFIGHVSPVHLSRCEKGKQCQERAALGLPLAGCALMSDLAVQKLGQD